MLNLNHIKFLIINGKYWQNVCKCPQECHLRPPGYWLALCQQSENKSPICPLSQECWKLMSILGINKYLTLAGEGMIKKGHLNKFRLPSSPTNFLISHYIIYLQWLITFTEIFSSETDRKAQYKPITICLSSQDSFHKI